MGPRLISVGMGGLMSSKTSIPTIFVVMSKFSGECLSHEKPYVIMRMPIKKFRVEQFGKPQCSECVMKEWGYCSSETDWES